MKIMLTNAYINKQRKSWAFLLLDTRCAKINLKMLILVCQRSAFDLKTFQKRTILKIVQGLPRGDIVLAELHIWFDIEKMAI